MSYITRCIMCCVIMFCRCFIGEGKQPDMAGQNSIRGDEQATPIWDNKHGCLFTIYRWSINILTMYQSTYCRYIQYIQLDFISEIFCFIFIGVMLRKCVRIRLREQDVSRVDLIERLGHLPVYSVLYTAAHTLFLQPINMSRPLNCHK